MLKINFTFKKTPPVPDKTLMRSTLILMIALLSPGLALAGTSSGGGGGGTSCGGRFLDNMIRQGKYQPKEDPAYKKYVQPQIDRIRKCLPFLADDLEMAISKPWYKVDCKLKVQFESTSYYAAEQLAYQDRLGVFLDSNILAKTDEENRGDLILHEAIQGIRIQRQLTSHAGEQEMEDSAVGILNEKLQSKEYKTCEDMREGVRKHLLNAYSTAPELKKWGVSLEKVKESARAACRGGHQLQLIQGQGYTPWRHFEKLRGPEDDFLKSWNMHFLHVPLAEEQMKYDAELRYKAKLQVRYDGQGFYHTPLSYRSKQEVCDAVGAPEMMPSPDNGLMKGYNNVVPAPRRKAEPDPLDEDDKSGETSAN